MTLFSPQQSADQPALIDMEEGKVVTYKELAELKKKMREFLPARKLIFLYTQNQWHEVAHYIALISSGHVVCLLDARLHAKLKDTLVAIYQPHLIYENGFKFLHNREKELHPDLSLLLSTSGTTGSPKMIRLSSRNILSNATSIISYLKIDAKERALASLPIHYSYGLSILHSHLLAGATTLLTRKSVVQKEFWLEAAHFAATSFAGVPYTYSLLDRLGFESYPLPALKTMTQAGGALSRELKLKFYQLMKKKGGRFFVMYGQTEATARIAYLSPEDLLQKVHAIGKAIPGCTLQIEGGELVCRGSNVMLGYANSEKDLALGDMLQGVLHTGDLGFCDEEGFFTLTGRAKRIAKIYGNRINLDEIEALMQPLVAVAALSNDEQIYLYFEKAEENLIEQSVKLVADKTHLHYSTFKTINCNSLPRTSSGKIDYARLPFQSI